MDSLRSLLLLSKNAYSSVMMAGGKRPSVREISRLAS